PPFIFPNPTNDIIHISFLEKEDNAKVELQLFDDLGRLLFFQKNGNQLDISSLPSGNYHLVIRYKGQVWNERVVKK
ncbi:MAG TPA: T9SS type A sorting domain-containing protein, partial [Phaeodactylibacter sp.]|nr:T9SS type A sorting domain-containing protein [Phaeodactylibacter sp.]